MSPVVVDKEEFHHVTGLVELVQQNITEIEQFITSEVISNCSKRLDDVYERLKSGKVRAGIVGLTKAGKSTTLNAILGNSFLPSSIQPQTANEVSIIHNPSTPNGELYAVRSRGGTPQLLAKGREEIYETLRELNDRKRSKVTSYSKLILYAPLPFLRLRHIENVQLELSDTPGLGEAGAGHVVSQSELAVKDMCAFVLILNVQFLKTEAESKLLSKLSTLHPQLFSKLKRILILVNAYDTTYQDDSPGSLQAHEIPEYVSKYLREPDVLGKNIPPHHIIPISARWALRSREWSSNASVLLKDKSARDIYNEAIILLRRAGYKDQVKPIEGKRNETTVELMSHYLEEFSHMGLVEKNLMDMLHTHGRAVLLESAVDDTLSVIKEIQDEVDLLIEKEDIHDKERCVSGFKEFVHSYEVTLEKHMDKLNMLHTLVKERSSAQINALNDALQDSLDGLVNSKLIEGLRDANQHDSKEYVQSRMRNAKLAIPTQAFNKMKTQWVQMVDVLHKADVEQVKAIFSALQAELLSTLNDRVEIVNMCNMATLENLSKKISENLKVLSLNPGELVPPIESLQLQLTYESKGSDAISDANLAGYILQGKKTIFDAQTKKMCIRSGFLGLSKDCFDITNAIPKEASTYSADFAGLQNAFKGVVQSWVEQLQSRFDTLCKKTSDSVSTKAQEQVNAAFSQPKEQLNHLFEANKRSLQESKDNIKFLERKKQEFDLLESKLQAFLDEQ